MSGSVEIPASVPSPPSGTYQLLVIVRHSRSRLTTHTQEIVVPSGQAGRRHEIPRRRRRRRLREGLPQPDLRSLTGGRGVVAEVNHDVAEALMVR